MSATAADRLRPDTVIRGTRESEVGRLKPAPTADCPLPTNSTSRIRPRRPPQASRRQGPRALSAATRWPDLRKFLRRHLGASPGCRTSADVHDDEHDRYTETETLVEDMCARRRGEAALRVVEHYGQQQRDDREDQQAREKSGAIAAKNDVQQAADGRTGSFRD